MKTLVGNLCVVAAVVALVAMRPPNFNAPRPIYTCDGSIVHEGEVWIVAKRPSGSLCLARPVAPPIPPVVPPADSTPVPPSPLPGFGHEPTGFTPISDNNLSAIPGSGWEWYGTTQPTIVQDPTATKSPPYVGRITYAQGFQGGSGQGQICKVGINKGSLYISAYLQFSANFEGHPTGANKLFYLNTTDEQTHVLPEADGVGDAALAPRFVLQNLAAPYPDQNGTLATTVGRRQNVGTGAQITRGKWTRYEYLLTTNTADRADGSVQEWQDGIQTFNLTGINFGAKTWGSVCWQPIWGGQGGVATRTFSMSLDNIYLSVK